MLSRFGSEPLKEMIPQLEQLVHDNFKAWSCQGSIDVKRVTAIMLFDFAAEKLFSYDPKNTSVNFGEKVREKMINTIKDVMKARRTSPELCRGDLLDQAMNDMNTEKYLTEDFIINFFIAVLFSSLESISSTLTVAFKLLSENPLVLEELKAEHQKILQKRGNTDAPLTWDEFKSMTFTIQVLHEILRLANYFPGLLRRALKDIQFNGYTIPAGWTIVVATSALHLNANTFEDPLAFNPWRWKEVDQTDVARDFMPFGKGTRQCAGAEFSRVFVAIFLHVLVTKYR